MDLLHNLHPPPPIPSILSASHPATQKNTTNQQCKQNKQNRRDIYVITFHHQKAKGKRHNLSNNNLLHIWFLIIMVHILYNTCTVCNINERFIPQGKIKIQRLYLITVQQGKSNYKITHSTRTPGLSQ